MAKRTTFSAQITAVARAARGNRHPALRAALASLVQLKRIADECRREEPDEERLTDILANLVMGS